jgi:hypothetical protein
VTEVLCTEERELVAAVEVEAVEVEAVDVEVVVDASGDKLEVNTDEELLGDWEAVPGVTVHCRTTCTRGSPFDPVTGVNVIVHVWVTGPALLQ